MKVYDLPDECPAPETDYTNYDWKAEQRKEDVHRQQLTNWLKTNGYGGKNSGRICRFGVGDGYAQYMLAEPTPGSGGASFLIHLPYGDAWHYPPIEHLPKKKILAECDRLDKLHAMFSKSVKENA